MSEAHLDTGVAPVAAPPANRKPFYRALYFQVIVAVVAGVLVGHFWPSVAVQLKPLGDGFIHLIKMVIGPVIFCTVVAGIAGLGDIRKVGRVGGKALLYFEVVSTVALVIGLLAGHLFKPGAGFDLDPSKLDSKALAGFTTQAHNQSVPDFLLHIIPNTFVDAFASGNVLQILLVSILFGVGLSAMGEKGRPVYDLIDRISHVFFNIVGIIMKVAQLGAFGAIAFTIGQYGVGSLGPLVKLILSFYVTLAFFTLVVLGLISRYLGFSILRFMSYIKDELLIVLGTSSSEAALPQMLQKLEAMGCSRPVVGLVVPAGYSFNLDGTNVYLTMAVLFIAQAFNVELSFMQEMTLIVVAMLSSKGASGVAGAAFVMLASTLLVIPVVPVSGMVLILGIHRFMGTGLALVNTIGNGVATVAIAAWERELDRDRLKQALAGR
ncbi:aerobic C4-dicarboxylate transport protein [Roseateles sp. YR242]|uniref:dicarboxylate/amino acid:cation symporter n=1 Tax=Roseateles sp. YR242 TaxID=1855305 RepID=UPI0008D20C36|nr:dicarboxylate/amino acid:cation symporter [Roseateles sp. YR242]SEL92030.1 aerobic C4-dicarboxylate transport protein [Roseateles sp. YR242]